MFHPVEFFKKIRWWVKSLDPESGIHISAETGHALSLLQSEF